MQLLPLRNLRKLIMKKYKVKITDKALSNMQEIYHYIAKQLQAPEAALRQYSRIADSIETLDIFPERIKIMKAEKEQALGLRQMLVDNYSVFFVIRENDVIITNVLYSASNLAKRLLDS